MSLEVIPYDRFGLLRFGQSQREECLTHYGPPESICKNRELVEEFHYNAFVVRFDPKTNAVQECTLLPGAVATIDGMELTWDQDFLRQACDRDGDPLDSLGFIVLKKLGIAVSGIHDHDKPQLAVTVFRKGLWDDVRTVPFLWQLEASWDPYDAE